MAGGQRLFLLQRPVLRVIGKFAGRVHGQGPLLVALGDSHTDPKSTYTAPWNIWLRHIGRRGYRTVNLGFSGATTRDMRAVIERVLDYGMPAAVIVFGGVNDAAKDLELAETADNARYILRWLNEHGIDHVMVIGTMHVNWTQPPDWWDASLRVRDVLREVATENHVAFVDLGAEQQSMIERGEVPNFAVEPYRQHRSWHVYENNQHLNARGQRLVADTVALDLSRLLA